MWIQSRTPSPSRRAETASSKSRAVAGSTVKVSSAVRSRRAGVARERVGGGVRGLVLEPRRGSRARRPRSADQRRDDVAGARRARRARRSRCARAPCVASAERDLARRAPGRRRASAHLRRRARTAARPTRKRPRRPTTAHASGPNRPRAASARPTTSEATRSSACVEPVVAVPGSCRRPATSGSTPLPRIEVPSAVRYSPTVRSRAPPASSGDHLLEDALAVGAGADHRRRGRSAAAPR